MKKDWEIKNPSTGLRADPSAWLMVKLGEVCDFQNGFAFKSKLFSQSGLPILRISNIQQDKISYNRLVFFNQINYNINFEKYKVKKGDLVIAMSGATTGKLAISNTDEIFYLNQRVGKFKPKKELLKEFLYYFLTTKIEENLKISQGAAQPNLSTIQIKNFEIPLPPLAKQKRIAGILDGVFENIEKAKEDTEKNLKNAKELFQSYLQRVFENPKDDWQTKKLGEVCDFQNGFAFKSKLFSQSGLPILRISNIQQDKISYNRLVFFNQTSYNINFEKYKVKKGDLVIAMSGATTGKLAISNTDEIFYLNQRVGKFKPKKELLKEFLYYFLTTKIEENLKISQGAAQPNLSTIQIKNFEIPLPPLSEQRRIVGRLDRLSEEVKKLEQAYQQKLNNLEELKKSILKQAFNNDL